MSQRSKQNLLCLLVLLPDLVRHATSDNTVSSVDWRGIGLGNHTHIVLWCGFEHLSETVKCQIQEHPELLIGWITLKNLPPPGETSNILAMLPHLLRHASIRNQNQACSEKAQLAYSNNSAHSTPYLTGPHTWPSSPPCRADVHGEYAPSRWFRETFLRWKSRMYTRRLCKTGTCFRNEDIALFISNAPGTDCEFLFVRIWIWPYQVC